MKHTHSFSVDTSCDCGVMLSEYTRKLTKVNAVLIESLEAAEKHLTAMCIMARENNFTTWNSNSTVQDLKKIREILLAQKETER